MKVLISSIFAFFALLLKVILIILFYLMPLFVTIIFLTALLYFYITSLETFVVCIALFVLMFGSLTYLSIHWK